MFKDGVTKAFKAFLLFPSKDEIFAICAKTKHNKRKKKNVLFNKNTDISNINQNISVDS